MGASQELNSAYDGSTLLFRLLRACGFGIFLNFGYFLPTDWLLHPFRIDIAQERLAKRSIRLLEVKPGDRVLDIACGRGKSSFFIAAQHPEAMVTGIDLNSSNIAIASGLYSNTANLKYRIDDANHLKFDDASFEKIHCLEAAFHFDRARFLSESFRVLSPGGSMVLVDFMWKEPDSRKVLDSPEATIVLNTWGFKDFSAVSEYLQIARDSGFHIIAKQDWSKQVTTALQRRFNLLTWACGQEYIRKIVSNYNILLNQFTAEDWEKLRESVRSHERVRSCLSYMCFLLLKN